VDQAGWNKAKALEVPKNIWIVYAPPYSPKLNPVERLWAVTLVPGAHEVLETPVRQGCSESKSLSPR
jgi:transposase